MKEYELSLLLHPDLEIDLDKISEKLKKLIADNGGEVVKEDNWGKRRLAYRIAGQDFAVYLFWDVKLPAPAVAKLDYSLNITDEVIRHLLVTVDEKARAAQAEAKQVENKTAEDEE